MKFKPNNNIFKLFWYPKSKNSTLIHSPLITPPIYHPFLSHYTFDVCSVTPSLKYLYGLDVCSKCIWIDVQAPSKTEPVPFTSLRHSRYFHHFSEELLIYMARYPCLSLVLGYSAFNRRKSSHVESFVKSMDVIAEFDDLIYTEVREDCLTKDARKTIARRIVKRINLFSLIKKSYCPKDWKYMFSSIRILKNLYTSGFRSNGGPFSWYTCKKYGFSRESRFKTMTIQKNSF